MGRKRKSTRKIAARKTPSSCLCCNEQKPWVEQTLPQTGAFRGQNHEFLAHVLQCRYCDEITMTELQTESNLQKLQKAHALWISKSLKSAKKYLSISHRDLAVAVKIGPATLSRIIKAESLTDSSTEELLLIKLKQLKQNHKINTLVKLPFTIQSSISLPDNSPWNPDADSINSGADFLMA